MKWCMGVGTMQEMGVPVPVRRELHWVALQVSGGGVEIRMEEMPL